MDGTKMKRRIVITFAIAAVLCSTALRAQKDKTAANVSRGGHGLDDEVLSQISKNLQAIVDRGESTGMVAVVARNGKIASVDAVSWRIKGKEPLEATDVFWAASITKSFVAVAIMMMVDEGPSGNLTSRSKARAVMHPSLTDSLTGAELRDLIKHLSTLKNSGSPK